MKIKIERHDGLVEFMELDEFSRWMCLAEALITIENKAKEKNIKMMDLKKKSSAISDYIVERFPSMRHDVEIEASMGNI